MLQQDKAITIDSKKSKSKKRKSDKAIHIIKLLKDNKYLLDCISDIYINMGLLKDEQFDMEEQTNKALKKLLRRGKSSITEVDEFKTIWLKMNNDDIGDVLEGIVALHGPYEYVFDKHDFSVESKVYETLKQNDFDIIFYECKCSEMCKEESKKKISGRIEFHECKKNISNCIPYDITKDPKEDMKKKLEFMVEVDSIVDESKIFMPTFTYDVSMVQEYLDKKEYGFIRVLGVRDLI